MCSPAVDHDGPSLWGIQELDLAHKSQEARGIAGDTMVRPAGEMEEAKLPDLVIAFLRREEPSFFQLLPLSVLILLCSGPPLPLAGDP